MILTVLSYPKKVKGLDTFKEEVPDETMTKEELALTQTLISASTLEEFDLASYEDDYVEHLSKLTALSML